MMSSTIRFSTTASAIALLAAANAAQAQGATATVPQAGTAAATLPASAMVAQDAATTSQSTSGATPADQAVPGADASDTDIVVTGLRRSLARAQEIKKNSDEIVDSLVAEDIGKFPDNNAIEAVARIPGVQIGRRNDEGFETLIRGLGQVSTTLNGRESFTINGRAFALQEFSADSLAGIDVFKANTAVNIEAGLGGLINVRLRRAFDLPPGLTVAGGLRGQYYDLTKKIDPSGSLLVSNRWQTGIGEIGILANVAYVGTRGYNQSVRYDGAFGVYANFPTAGQVINYADGRSIVTTYGTERQNNTAIPATNRFHMPNDMGLFFGRGKRFRPSATLSLQWAPDNDTMLYAEAFYQGLRADIRDTSIGFNLRGAYNNNILTVNNAVVSSANGELGFPYLQSGSVTYNPAVYAGSGPGANFNGRRIELDTVQAAIGGTKTAGNVKLSADIAYTDSWQLDWVRNLNTYISTPFTLAFETNAGYGAQISPNINLADVNNFRLRNFDENYTRLRGTSWQGRFDGVINTESSFLTEIDFGLRASTRSAKNYGGGRNTGAVTQTANIPLTSLPGYEPFVGPTPFRGDLQQSIDGIAGLNADIWTGRWADYRQFFIAQNNARAVPVAGFNALFSTAVPTYDVTRRVTGDEQVYSAYAQLKTLVDIGFPIDGIFGARIINTVTNVKQIGRPAGVLTQFSNGSNYVDVLPNFSLRARFTEKLQARASYTQSLFRPAFAQISPALNYGTTTGSFLGASRGNPDLNPVRSDNWDASLEYYFARTGSITLGVFQKDVSGFIVNVTQRLSTVPGVPCPDAVIAPACLAVDLTQPFNAGKGKLKGVEAAFNSFFTFLPSPLDGFGLGANVTYIDAEQRLPIPTALATNVNTVVLGPLGQIPGVSKWTYNITGYYEKGPAGLRVSYNRRSSFATNFNSLGSVAQPFFVFDYTKAISRLDVSGNIRLTNWITITADATNLLAKPFENYRFAETYPVDVRYESRVYSIGARFRF